MSVNRFLEYFNKTLNEFILKNNFHKYILTVKAEMIFSILCMFELNNIDTVSVLREMENPLN